MNKDKKISAFVAIMNMLGMGKSSKASTVPWRNKCTSVEPVVKQTPEDRDQAIAKAEAKRARRGILRREHWQK